MLGAALMPHLALLTIRSGLNDAETLSAAVGVVSMNADAGFLRHLPLREPT